MLQIQILVNNSHNKRDKRFDCHSFFDALGIPKAEQDRCEDLLFERTLDMGIVENLSHISDKVDQNGDLAKLVNHDYILVVVEVEI